MRMQHGADGIVQQIKARMQGRFRRWLAGRIHGAGIEVAHHQVIDGQTGLVPTRLRNQAMAIVDAYGEVSAGRATPAAFAEISANTAKLFNDVRMVCRGHGRILTEQYQGCRCEYQYAHRCIHPGRGSTGGQVTTQCIAGNRPGCACQCSDQEKYTRQNQHALPR